MNRLSDPIVLNTYNSLKGRYPSTTLNFVILKVAITDPAVKAKYDKKAAEHNKKMFNCIFADSGFDLLVPDETTVENEASVFVDFKIKTEMLYCDVDKDLVTNSAFLIHPRSSISKTPLMLANHTGIIDTGYRGNIIGAFRNLDTEKPYIIEQDTRLLQICHPSLCPIFVVFVGENELTTTERMAGGFGSTGKA